MPGTNNNPEQIIPAILKYYALSAEDFSVERIGTGHIHHTYLLKGNKSYILQRVNKNVFKQPEVIASNLRIAREYLGKKFTEFLFLAVVPTHEGEEMVYDGEGFPWRLFPYIENTFTIDKVTSEDEAFSAAAEFGRLTRYLNDADVTHFKPSIQRFHDLAWRYDQFETALKNTSEELMKRADAEIAVAKSFAHLVEQYDDLVKSGDLKLRITHNDTKINNILFDKKTGKAVCAIDLDTLMPGYFIYDLGDMIRTFVSPADEEEKDFSRITVRENIYDALIKGYLSQMDSVLTEQERTAIRFSGQMMTYMIALRFLTDYLNGNVYYQIRYPEQNLVRAGNQLKLLAELSRDY